MFFDCHLLDTFFFFLTQEYGEQETTHISSSIVVLAGNLAKQPTGRKKRNCSSQSHSH